MSMQTTWERIAGGITMNAPDRSAEVAAFVNANGNLFKSRTGVEADSIRREALVPICQHLNAIDDGKWGRLTKLDQGGKIPADIIVWKDTKEHFDILTGADRPEDTQPTWDAKGPARDGWEWLEVPATILPTPPSQPTETKPDPSAVALNEIRNRLVALEALVERQAQRIVDSERTTAALAARIEALESKPEPKIELPELFVEGPTDRVLGHAHTISLPVRRR
jgi:hypothetical protein